MLNFLKNNMTDSKLYNFKSRILAIIFLFLNAVCIASPAIKTAYENEGQSVTIPFINDFNTVESEEEISGTSFINNHKSLSSANKSNNNRSEKNYLQRLVLSVQNHFSPFIKNSAFLPTPHYYTFLFRFKPF